MRRPDELMTLIRHIRFKGSSLRGICQALAFPRLDILINNAAQTVRRPAAHYAELVRGEAEALEQRLVTRHGFEAFVGCL